MRKKESKLQNETLTSLFVAIWNRSKNRCAIVDMSPFTTLFIGLQNSIPETWFNQY